MTRDGGTRSVGVEQEDRDLGRRCDGGCGRFVPSDEKYCFHCCAGNSDGLRADGGTEENGVERLLDQGERSRQLARGEYGNTELEAKIRGPDVTADEYHESLEVMKLHQGEGSLAGWSKLSIPADVDRLEEFIAVLEDARDELLYLRQAKERPQPGDRDE